MHDLICGKLLGDGCLVKQSSRKPRFQFTHCINDIEYSWHCYEHLSSFLPLNPPKYKKNIDSRVISGFTESYYVQSRTSEEICRLYELWYPRSKKEIPFSYIEEHFTERTLAWWYQDDGHLKSQNGIPRKIILSTDCFSIEENQFLIKFLKKKYDLFFSKDAQNRLILYDQFQIIFFLTLIDPHIHSSMNRKKLIFSKARQIAERTTISLSSEINITHPTAEINSKYKNLSFLVALIENQINLYENYKISKPSSVKRYQIKITEDSRTTLSYLKQKTGLTINQLTEWCFRL